MVIQRGLHVPGDFVIALLGPEDPSTRGPVLPRVIFLIGDKGLLDNLLSVDLLCEQMHT